MTESILIPTGDPDIDTLALQTAVNDVNLDTITIAPGIFAIGKRAVRAGARLSNRNQPLHIRGAESAGTVLRLVDMTGGSGGDCHVLAFDFCKNLVLENLTIDGNRAAFPGFNQQAHGVYINGCQNVIFCNVHTRQVIMDGFYFIGSQGELCQYITMKNTSHQGNNRSGIAVQGGVSDVAIVEFLARDIKNSAIDTEPTGGTPPVRFTIRRARIYPRQEGYAVSIANSNDFYVDDLEIVDGCMQVFNAVNVTLNGLRIYGRGERPPLTVRGAVDNLVINGGEYIGRHNQANTDGAITIGSHNNNHPESVAVIGATVTSVARHGIQAENCNHLRVIGCHLRGSGLSTGIHYKNVTRTEGIGGCVIDECTIANYQNGILGRAYSDKPIRVMVSQGGKLSTLINGVFLEGHEYIEQRLFAHELEAVTTAVKLQA